MPLRVWPLEGPMLQWMAPKPCIYGQLIVLGGLLETGRGVVRGEGGISRTRRGGVRGSEGTPVYISLHMCTKFSQNRKEKNMPVRTSIGHGGLCEHCTSEELRTRQDDIAEWWITEVIRLFLEQLVTLNLPCEVYHWEVVCSACVFDTWESSVV